MILLAYFKGTFCKVDPSSTFSFTCSSFSGYSEQVPAAYLQQSPQWKNSSTTNVSLLVEPLPPLPVFCFGFCFGLWEETEVTKEKPCIHVKKMQAPPRQVPSWEAILWPFCWQAPLTTVLVLLYSAMLWFCLIKTWKSIVLNAKQNIKYYSSHFI